MLNDQMLQLAFSVYNNPGVYALLLGSGVSRSASIPTGWEVVTDLINQAALALGEDLPEMPEVWFKQRFGQEPGYDALLEALGKSSFERNAILRRYFEPTDKEREQGIKLPAAAHRAIAWFIKQGYFRVVVTTNFDRLLEMALEDEGIRPDVISSQSQLEGMRPLQHSNITIIKLHGDYLDGNFKNTAEELAVYTDEMNALLDRIFDEYGLVVCGWSGEWDTALRQAIERTVQRRYSTFWLSYTSPQKRAQKLIDHRDAQMIANMSSDDFFGNLRKMVFALERSNKNNPLSVTVAVQHTKRLIPDAGSYIELEEFFRSEVERAFGIFTSEDFIEQRVETVQASQDRQKTFRAVWELYYEVTEIPLNMAAVIAWYGTNNHSRYFTEAIERWIELPFNKNDHDERFNIWRFLPVLSLIYVTGVALAGNQNWTHLPAILKHPRVLSPRKNQTLAVTEVIGDEVILDGLLRGMELDRFPISICTMLRQIFQELMPSEQNYGRAFDVFDMFWGLLYLDQYSESGRDWEPGFSLIYEGRSWKYLTDFWKQAATQGKDWQVLQLGLFEGETDRVQNALERFIRFVHGVQEGKAFMNRLPDYAQVYNDHRPDVIRSGTIPIPKR
ncbi:MAG TPA: SIR2 family protein [Bellilinea sp.]|nr:SIR2 family protein [Bellilinea sp.]